MPRICYLVYNINDPHVHRRIELLRAAGAMLDLVGFSRSDDPTPAGVTAVDMGRTKNGALGKRILSVVKALFDRKPYRRYLEQADVVFVRNLEMLVIAAAVLRGHGKTPRLIYESLDVHRALSGDGLKHRLLRRLERALIERCDLLVTSSPRFIAEHFERHEPLPIPHVVVENKVFALDGGFAEQRSTSDSPPWIIGWFGLLRCRKSLAKLTEIANRADGKIEVLIAGRPSYNEMPDFDEVVQGAANVRFVGSYTAADLAKLYGGTHFAWCIDYLEEGHNSSWLLPNRIYEASACGAVPIGLAEVETGAWLQRQGIGICVTDPVDGILARLGAMSTFEYRLLLQQVRAVPRERLFATRDDGVDLLQALTGEAPRIADEARNRACG